MVGIKSVGAYIPMYRLSGDEIAKMWGGKRLVSEKAVAGSDEDSITMAVAAGLGIGIDDPGNIDGLFFATTTAPYKEKQAAAIIASALDLKKSCYTGDFSNSLRAGSLALRSACYAVQGGSSGDILVIASDCRVGAAQSPFEQFFGDAAGAVTVGSNDVIASIEGSHSLFNEFIDTWRTEDDVFERGSEERFVDAVGYRPMMTEVMSGVMEKYKVTARDFAKIVYYAPDARSHSNLGKSMRFEKYQIQDHLYGQIGNTGTAAGFIMLADALNNAKTGDRILFVTYGDGADAFILRVTENIEQAKQSQSIRSQIESKVLVSYPRYAVWKGLVKLEASKLAGRPALFRSSMSIAGKVERACPVRSQMQVLWNAAISCKQSLRYVPCKG